MIQKLHALKFLFTGLLFVTTLNGFSQQLDWAKQFGGTQNLESLDITLDAQGNVYTTGWFEGIVDFDPNASVSNLTSNGSRDIFISKQDSSGNLIWAKNFGGTGFDQAYSVFVDPNGNVFLTGWFQNTVDFNPGMGTFEITAGNFDVFVLKLDANGDFVWAKGTDGENVNIGYSVIADDNGVYVTGRFQGTVDFDPSAAEFNITASGLIDTFTMKLSTSGDLLWVKQFGATGVNIGEAVALDSFGNVLTLARFNSTVDFDPSANTFNLTSFGGTDAVIVKLDTNGDFIWAKQLGGSSDEEPSEMVIDSNNNIYTTGYFSSTADFDPSANQSLLTSKGSFDVFVSKLDGNGDFVWAKQIGGTGGDDGKGLDVDSSGNVYASGIFQGTLDADPSANTFALTSYGDNDVYFVKLDNAGDFVWATHFGGTNKDLGRAITVNKTTMDAYVTGTFEGVADFDSTASSVTLTSNGQKDVFVAKLNDNSLSLADKPNKTAFTVYPNPVLKTLHIVSNDLNIKTIDIIDITGRVVKTHTFNSKTITPVLDVESLSSGTFILKINSDAGIYFKRFLKE